MSLEQLGRAGQPGRSGRWRRWVRTAASRTRHVPLRVKLVLLTCALVTGALISTGFAATNLLRHSLMNRVDSQLVSASHQITQGLPRRFGRGTGGSSQIPGGIPPGTVGATVAASCASTNSTDSTTETRPRLPSPYWVRTSDDAGTPTGVSSIPLDQSDCGPAVPTLTLAAVKAHLGKPFTVPSKTGSGRWRVVVSLMSGGQGSIAVATPLTGVDSTLNQLVLFDVIIGAAVLVILAGLSYLAVRRSLRPLVDVEHTAAAIAAGDLSRRVPESDPRTEVGKLAGALNGMLSQIESAFRAREASEQEARTSEHRMRRFITDASHELRTPLTSIRGFAELYRMGAVTDEPDVHRVMGRIESESTRMGLLVDDLLLLARLDQQRPLEREPVDLSTIAEDAAHDAQAVAPGRDVRLEVTTDGPVIVLGDDARLRQVVGNLVTNALTHTSPSATVTIRLSTSDAPVAQRLVRVAATASSSAEPGGALPSSAAGRASGEPTHPGDTPPADSHRWAVLEIADSGPGLSAKDAERVFERFYRVDESRTRANGGSGLGLSIVAALTAAHGGTADVETELGHGSCFRIRLPLATS